MFALITYMDKTRMALVPDGAKVTAEASRTPAKHDRYTFDVPKTGQETGSSSTLAHAAHVGAGEPAFKPRISP